MTKGLISEMHMSCRVVSSTSFTYLGGKCHTAVGFVVIKDHHLAPLADGEQCLEIVDTVVRDLRRSEEGE